MDIEDEESKIERNFEVKDVIREEDEFENLPEFDQEPEQA